MIEKLRSRKRKKVKGVKVTPCHTISQNGQAKILHRNDPNFHKNFKICLGANKNYLQTDYFHVLKRITNGNLHNFRQTFHATFSSELPPLYSSYWPLRIREKLTSQKTKKSGASSSIERSKRSKKTLQKDQQVYNNCFELRSRAINNYLDQKKVWEKWPNIVGKISLKRQAEQFKTEGQ